MMSQNPSFGQSDGPTCKKIQNYIFKFSDLLGQGNFSKVYKAHHEITSKFTVLFDFRWSSCHKDRWTKLSQVKKTIITPFLRNQRPQKAKSSQHPQMLLSFYQQSQLLHHYRTLQLGRFVVQIEKETPSHRVSCIVDHQRHFWRAALFGRTKCHP